MIRYGKTEKVLASLVKALHENGDKIEGIYMQKEVRVSLHVMRFPMTTITGQRRSYGIRARKDLHGRGGDGESDRKVCEAMERECDVLQNQDPEYAFTFHHTSVHIPPCSHSIFPLLDGQSPPRRPTLSRIPNTGCFHPVSKASRSARRETSPNAPWDPVETILTYLLKSLEGDFGMDTKKDHSRDSKSAFPFRGGETAALERLDWYFQVGWL